MLIELFGENFGCFRDEFRLSMLAADIDPDSDRGIVTVKVEGDPEPLRLLRCAAIYGPNASGKSTILRAAAALHSLLFRSGRMRSDERIDAYEPFAGDLTASKPSRIGIKCVVAGVVYDYEVGFTNRQIVYERLDRYSLEKVTTLILRQEEQVSGEWSNDPQFQLITKSFRPTALMLSLADSLFPELVGGLATAFRKLLQFSDGTRINSFRPGEHAARKLRDDPDFKAWLMDQMTAADIGVSDVNVKRLLRRPDTEQGLLFEELSDESEAPTGGLIHYRMEFSHAGEHGPFRVPYSMESLGTLKLVELAPVLYRLTSEAGRVALIDEIGASLHPHLVKAIVEHVNCRPLSCGLSGQMVFATHETSLIDGRAKLDNRAPVESNESVKTDESERVAILRRDQVYFTEKGVDGASRLYSLAEFKERNVVNLRKRYLEGRYGAVPTIGLFPE